MQRIRKERMERSGRGGQEGEAKREKGTGLIILDTVTPLTEHHYKMKRIVATTKHNIKNSCISAVAATVPRK